MARPDERRGRNSGRPAPARTPPPESTGREARYLERRKATQNLITVHLMNGTVIEGTVEYFDQRMIKITRSGQANLLLLKSDIRYLADDL